MTVKTVDELGLSQKQKQIDQFHRSQRAESKNMYFNVVLSVCFRTVAKKVRLCILGKK